MGNGKLTGCVVSIPIIAFIVVAVITHIHLHWLLWVVIGVFLWQTVSLAFYGRGDGESNGDSFWEIRKHNAAIEKRWRKDGKPIVETTIGWRPDPWNKEDGYRKDPPNGQEYYGDGYSYSKLIRGGTKEYREKFAKDVEDSKK